MTYRMDAVGGTPRGPSRPSWEPVLGGSSPASPAVPPTRRSLHRSGSPDGAPYGPPSSAPTGPPSPTPSSTPSRTPAGPPGSDADEPGDDRPRRRPPWWLLVLIAVVVVGAVVALVLVLNRPGTPDPLEPEVITLPEPTPTIDPVERAEGTAFFEALPSEVLDYALVDYGDWDDPLLSGGVEGYYLVYDNGTSTVTLYAGQWRDAEATDAALVAAVAAAQDVPLEEPAETEPEPEATDTATEGTPTAAPVTEPEEGTVEVDGQQVGRYVLVPRADGTGSLVWTNQTVMLRLDGPVEELRDIFTAFPL